MIRPRALDLSICLLLRYQNPCVNISSRLVTLGPGETHARLCPRLLAARVSQIGNRPSSAASPPFQPINSHRSSPAATRALHHLPISTHPSRNANR